MNFGMIMLNQYDYIKPKYQNKSKICYIDTDSFIIHNRTEDFYQNIADDVEKWYDRRKRWIKKS